MTVNCNFYGCYENIFNVDNYELLTTSEINALIIMLMICKVMGTDNSKIAALLMWI